MKNMALTIARLVLPLVLDAVRDKSGDITAVMQEAFEHQLLISRWGVWLILTSHAAAIIPQPASTVSRMRSTLPTSGGMIRTIVTKVRFLGNSQQPKTPIHKNATCTAPEGAV